MGLMDFIKGELLEVIEWTDDSRDTLSFRFPDDDKAIKNGAQLIVRESQQVQFVYLGEFGDTFGPGRHTLTTENIPILTKLKSWKYGFNSPFKADVYYVTTRLFTGNKWGTSNPIMMRDDDPGVRRGEPLQRARRSASAAHQPGRRCEIRAPDRELHRRERLGAARCRAGDRQAVQHGRRRQSERLCEIPDGAGDGEGRELRRNGDGACRGPLDRAADHAAAGDAGGRGCGSDGRCASGRTRIALTRRSGAGA